VTHPRLTPGATRFRRYRGLLPLSLKTKFAWQEGYGSFTVSCSQIAVVRKYIQNQEKHHKTRTYEQEFLKLLKVHGIQYDERFVFD